jgi:chromate reductase
LRAAALVAHGDVEVTLYEGLGDLPMFNPDIEATEPPAVMHLRTQISDSVAVMIASPEYAHGITGVLKNAPDWRVGCGTFGDKLVALLNA